MVYTTINSLQNGRVKTAAKLRSRRGRAKQGRFLIDGAREISRAIDAGVKLVEAFVCDSLCSTEEAREAAQKLRLGKQASVWFGIDQNPCNKGEDPGDQQGREDCDLDRTKSRTVPLPPHRGSWF